MRIGRSIWGLWAVTSFIVVCLPVVTAITALPQQSRRRRAARRAATGCLWLAGIPIDVSGLHHVPETGCIVVANHASYLDGILLTAVLPPRFSFVIKREMSRVPLAHLLLRRIGAEFVERHDTQKSAVDARRLLLRARERMSLAFFPEGTFRREPGLGHFHHGAFRTATRNGLPVIPVIIRGTRDVLPAGQLLPRPGRLEVIVKPPLETPPGDRGHALADAARRCILEDLGEPDLINTVPGHFHRAP